MSDSHLRVSESPTATRLPIAPVTPSASPEQIQLDDLSQDLLMEYSQIEVGRVGEIALITLSRPQKLNAWTPTMAEEQASAIMSANADPTIGAIVMTGAGRGFCAGADMESTFKSRIDGVDPGRDTASGTGGMPAGLDWVALTRGSKPIVCAINGAAVGIGVTMCLPCDQIVASTRSKFGMGFITVGLVPELASSRLLAARVGLGRATDLFLSGRIIGADEAHRIGLVDRLVEPDDLLAVSLDVARSYAAHADRQLRMTKQLLTDNIVETDLQLIQQREQEFLTECWRSDEHREAVEAFIEKRRPVFRPEPS